MFLERLICAVANQINQIYFENVFVKFWKKINSQINIQLISFKTLVLESSKEIAVFTSTQIAVWTAKEVTLAMSQALRGSIEILREEFNSFF